MKSKTLIGTKLSNFKVERLVASGGMADVYYGIDENLHRPVAIKVIETTSRAKSAQAHRFLQEARVMANWRHENIVQIFYAGDEHKLFYYVMEYIDGYDLASIMSVYQEQGELMPVEDVLRIGDSIATALDYAHSQNIIHRDVKPANVMVANSDGRVVLGDFGLALDLNDKTQGDVFGSPHYIAPEQARRSSDAVPQSDLYSLGVILYEMFTGETPFNDPAPASLALQHITEDPPLPRNINPSISVQVEKVLLKALEKSPQDRYQSGNKLMTALRKAVKAAPERTSSDTSALPPIPVNAPTIRRSNMSLNAFTKRDDVITALKEITTARVPVDVDLVNPPRKKRRFGWLFLLLFLLFAFIGFSTFRSEIMGQLAMLQQVPTNLPTQTESATQPPATDTALPTATETTVPPTQTSTETPLPTATATVTTTDTQTTTPLSTATATRTKPPTVVAGTATSNATGYLMTAYYNDNSFYMLNKAGASRSASGFVFERIDKDSVIQERFDGWKWEVHFKNVAIQPNRCLALEIYLSPDPYLSPIECNNRTLSTLSLIMPDDESYLFWTPDNNSEQFRILWLGEEIARCEIEAGTCDFYVP